MTTLSQDAPRKYFEGDFDEYSVIADDIIYQGAAVGIVAASGHAQPLTTSNVFAGFAELQVDNTGGAAAAKKVRVRRKGTIQLDVSSAVITDVGQPVYASDDDTFTLVVGANVFVGYVRQYVSDGVVIVQFDADLIVAP